MKAPRYTYLAITSFLLCAVNAACTVGDDIEADGEEVDTDLLAASGGLPSRLPYGAWVSDSTKERAFTSLSSQLVAESIDFFSRELNVNCMQYADGRTCEERPQDGEFVLSRNPTTGVRYIRFYKLDNIGARGALIDKYSYVMMPGPFGIDLVSLKLRHEATGTEWRMDGVSSLCRPTDPPCI